ncbi:MAG: FAD-dependent monooxygenase [Pseudomonadota bacterium]
MTENVDVLVAGGGIAGLSAACAFATDGFSVVCVDPSPPITDRRVAGADLRTTAFLQPARRFLERAGVWSGLAEDATPLNTMRILDAGGARPEPRLTCDFEAEDIGEASFGYNVANTAMRRALLERVDALANLDFICGARVEEVEAHAEAAQIRLDSGQTIAARLLIAADGRDSSIRANVGIGVRRHDFRQKALTFAVRHDAPHDFVSTEVHRHGGPFTLVPLPDFEGAPSSAVVWMEPNARADALMALDDEAFNAAATERSAGIHGALTLLTRRAAWPIVSQLARRFDAPRTALVAEAAHVMPPIGAQGLNTSVKDLKALLDLAQANRAGLGDASMLRRYHRARFSDVAARIVGISTLNQASMVALRPFRDARAAGLYLLHNVTPIRRSLMRLGLGR